MNHRPARKITTAIVGVSAAALLLSACGGSTTTPAATGASSAAGSAAGSSAAGSSAAGASGPQSAESGWCDAVKAQYPGLSGTVGVYSVIVSPEDTPYINTYKDFTDCTGVAVSYEGSKEFEAQVGVRVASGNPPDIAVFPQPGLLSQLVNTTGQVKPLPEFVKTNAAKYFPADWLNYGTVNGLSFGIPNNADFKSLVWYSPKTFKDKGYTVPTNWDELTALTDQIANAGEKPWCIGIASGEATGWQITDWLEEYVLRYAGPEVYDQWVSHEVKFADEPIVSALAQVGALLKDPKYVNAGFGDVATIASTQFNDVKTPLLSGECTLSRQAANFDSNFEGSTIGPDGDINAFYFPPANDQFGTTVLGGGTFYAAFTDRPEVQAFEYYLTTPEYANKRAQEGSYISSNLGLQVDSVASPVQQEALKTLQNPDTTFRFDASDLMPAPVGADAEWKQFTAWVTGQDDATTLANIDAAWPAS